MSGRQGGWWVAGLVGLLASGWCYVENRPLTISLALLFCVPVAWIVTQGRRSRPDRPPGLVERYRFLLIVYAPVLVLAAWEIEGPGEAGDPAVFVESRVNYAQTMRRLFPDRDEYRFLSAYQFRMCVDASDRQRAGSPVCRNLSDVDLEAVRVECERAIDSRVRSNPGVYLLYIEVLERLGEDEATIDRVWAELVRHHPSEAARRTSLQAVGPAVSDPSPPATSARQREE